jgi:hypothetical protein
VSAPSVETLAQALYETDSGHDGYPPLHETTPWADIVWRDTFYERAREILRLLSRGGVSPSGKGRGE